MSALTNQQKAHLAQLARRAFNLIGARLRALDAVTPAGTLQGDLDQLAVDGGNQAFGEWRHGQVKLVVAKDGLRVCSQLDYKRVEAHVRAETEPRRQAEAVLVEACNRWGFHLNYAANLCRRIHRVALDDASPAIIWKVIYTINNRGRAKADKQKEIYASN